MTTPTSTAVSERVLLMLEIIAKAEEPPTLNELVTLIELPKATTHRLVTRLEKLGFAQRSMDGRRYEIGYRLTSLALGAMRHLRRTAGENIAEYLQEEGRDLVNKTELDEFMRGVDGVRETADRVEARLQRLEARRSGAG